MRLGGLSRNTTKLDPIVHTTIRGESKLHIKGMNSSAAAVSMHDSDIRGHKLRRHEVGLMTRAGGHSHRKMSAISGRKTSVKPIRFVSNVKSVCNFLRNTVQKKKTHLL